MCCLSFKFEKYDQWFDHSDFILDVMKFLDNVMEDFIARALRQ